MADPDEYLKLSGTVLSKAPNASFIVRVEGNLEVLATASGRMRRGRGIRILPGDRVDVEVSTYDVRRGRIVWRYRGDAPPAAS